MTTSASAAGDLVAVEDIAVKPVSRPGVHSTLRFYDTSPISPSGRFVALTEFYSVDRLPAAGDLAKVVVLELATSHVVYTSDTAAWDTQLGAQVQWGASDTQLFYNRMDPGDWRPYGVVVDIFSREERTLDGPVYVVSPDGRTVLSPDLVRIWSVQPGYGVLVPPERRVSRTGARGDDGLYVTDVESGSSRLALSFRHIVESIPHEFSHLDLNRGSFYGFHAKWSPDGQRIMFIIRWRDKSSRRGQSLNWLLTMRSDFTDLRVAINPERWAGGHHPNWCPDSSSIVMNLAFPRWPMRAPRLWHITDRVARRLKIPAYPGAFALRLARFGYDGADLRAIAPNQTGSGHPTYHSALRAVLTDAYPWEEVAAGDGTSPIRLISDVDGESETLITVRTQPQFVGSRREWRVDPHPAWSTDRKSFVFNGLLNGVRTVFLADLSGRISGKRDNGAGAA